MHGQLRELLSAHPAWNQVLTAYEANIAAARDASPDFDGWVPRLREVADVPEGQLAPIHGKLIAHGLLEFVLDDRNLGVRYRLSTAARQLLGNAIPASDDDEESLAA